MNSRPRQNAMPTSAWSTRGAAAAHFCRSLRSRWGALAFGAVYPWAYWPLAALLVAAGLAALAVASRANIDGTSRELKLALFGIGAAIALQIVPVPNAIVRGGQSADANRSSPVSAPRLLRASSRFILSRSGRETRGPRSHCTLRSRFCVSVLRLCFPWSAAVASWSS